MTQVNATGHKRILRRMNGVDSDWAPDPDPDPLPAGRAKRLARAFAQKPGSSAQQNIVVVRLRLVIGSDEPRGADASPPIPRWSSRDTGGNE